MATSRATEQVLPDLKGFDTWSNARILAELLEGQRRALDAVEHALPSLSAAADGIAARLRVGGKLFYAGAGTSIRVAVQDGSELPATFGMDPDTIGYLIAGGERAIFETLADAEDDEAQGILDGKQCTAEDVLIAVAASGRTPYTLGAAKAARANGCLVIAVVNNATSDLAATAEIEVLLNSGPEVISGSTRLGAGTAQKAALNLLSTLVHTKLGAVHDGYMVNVQSGNEKLAERAAHIVATISGAKLTEAKHALETSEGNVKLAVLLAAGTPDLPTAQALLAGSNQVLRKALAKGKFQV
jgi:N-acetylmuramic acid 6-phosphate etherase